MCTDSGQHTVDRRWPRREPHAAAQLAIPRYVLGEGLERCCSTHQAICQCPSLVKAHHLNICTLLQDLRRQQQQAVLLQQQVTCHGPNKHQHQGQAGGCSKDDQVHQSPDDLLCVLLMLWRLDHVRNEDEALQHQSK